MEAEPDTALRHLLHVVHQVCGPDGVMAVRDMAGGTEVWLGRGDVEPQKLPSNGLSSALSAEMYFAISILIWGARRLHNRSSIRVYIRAGNATFFRRSLGCAYSLIVDGATVSGAARDVGISSRALFRARSKHSVLPPDVFEEVIADPSIIFDREEIRSAIDRAVKIVARLSRRAKEIKKEKQRRERHALIRDGLSRGLSQRRIAEAAGMSPSGVKSFVDRMRRKGAEITFHHGPVVGTKVDGSVGKQRRQDVATAILEGLTISQAATRLKVSKRTVFRACKQIAQETGMPCNFRLEKCGRKPASAQNQHAP